MRNFRKVFWQGAMLAAAVAVELTGCSGLASGAARLIVSGSAGSAVMDAGGDGSVLLL